MGAAELTPLVDPGALLQPLRLRNAGEQIADRLVMAIALGGFAPGQRLPTERELSTRLGVSRASVREAIHRLAAGGYVTVQRGRNGGAVVQAGWEGASGVTLRARLPDREHVEWLFDLRSLIEPLIARTAAERRDQADCEAIAAALDGYQAAMDAEASRAADQALHDAIARATHNPYLVGVSRQMRARISIGFGAEPYSRSVRATAAVQHTDLAAAVARGEADEAARVAARHVALTQSSRLALAERAGAGGRRGEGA